MHGTLPFCEPMFRAFSELRALQVPPPLIVIATESSQNFAVAALRAGAQDYFDEPLNHVALTDTVISLLQSSRRHEPADTGVLLVGGSPVMESIRQQIVRIGATDSNVLITGETGTGKELVAQLVHQNSARRMYPIVCINCAAIPDTLLESELFGYERGAFTGANSPSQGKLMSANKGTVFFDEIGDMSPYAQAKVLRLIECKEVQRLGSTRRLTTDVRILAATHHDLEDLTSKGEFRQDLYFRLNVGRIHLPPLRERKSDIGDLVARTLADLNHKLGRRIEGVTEDGMGVLTDYDWPGNVRELKNVLERIFIDRLSGRITEGDLHELLPTGSDRFLSRRYDEMQLLRTTLVSCEWNKSKAAERLRWSRMTLYRKIAKYGLTDESIRKGVQNTREDAALASETELA
jgi:DNA-binding NtrC family response regulator